MVSINELLKKMIQRIIDLNSNTVNKSVITSIYTKRNFTTTFANGTNWKADSFSGSDAYLFGNTLRIHFQGTRSSSSGAGNITNEHVCTITVKDIVPYISNVYNVTATGMGYGGVASLYTYGLEFSGNNLIIKIGLSATHAAISSTNSCFMMPVLLRASAFGV